jgi:hypothetical protein
MFPKMFPNSTHTFMSCALPKVERKDMTFYFVKCTIFPQSFENFNVTNEKPHVTLQMEGALYDVMHSQELLGIFQIAKMPISMSVSLFKMLALCFFLF